MEQVLDQEISPAKLSPSLPVSKQGETELDIILSKGQINSQM